MQALKRPDTGILREVVTLGCIGCQGMSEPPQSRQESDHSLPDFLGHTPAPEIQSL